MRVFTEKGGWSNRSGQRPIAPPILIPDISHEIVESKPEQTDEEVQEEIDVIYEAERVAEASDM